MMLAVIVWVGTATSSAFAQDLGKLPDPLRRGVLRAGLGQTPDIVCRAGAGDDVTVEVKNLNGWVMEMVDEGKLHSLEPVRNAPAGVKKLIDNQQFRFAIEAANWMAGYVWDKPKVLPADELTALNAAHKSNKALWKYKAPSLEPPFDQGESPDKILASFRESLDVLHNLMAAIKPQLTMRINGQTLTGITPLPGKTDPVGKKTRPPATEDDDYFWFHFTLQRNAGNEAAWSKLLSRPLFTLPAALTLAVSTGNEDVELPTAVTPDTADPRCTFAVAGMPYLWTGAAIAIVLFCLGVFVFCASTTDILRDVDGDLRPDGRRPFSLAKTQMAAWFFLIITSFLFLWIVTNQINTLNDTCLWLIGIGSGTALGSAIIAAGNKPGQQTYPETFDYSLRQKEIRSRLETLITATVQQIKEAAKKASAEEQKALTERLEALKKQKAHLEAMPHTAWRRVLTDWLSENGSGGAWSFHRFQMLAWTLVLSLIFIGRVWSDLKIPEFSTQLLALVGISAGTYLGFKLQPDRPAGQENT